MSNSKDLGLRPKQLRNYLAYFLSLEHDNGLLFQVIPSTFEHNHDMGIALAF